MHAISKPHIRDSDDGASLSELLDKEDAPSNVQLSLLLLNKSLEESFRKEAPCSSSEDGDGHGDGEKLGFFK